VRTGDPTLHLTYQVLCEFGIAFGLHLVHEVVPHGFLRFECQIADEGLRGKRLSSEPSPMEKRKFDDCAFPQKNSKIGALLKPDIGPQSNPRAHAATTKQAD
jgi:hypothetical protein